MDPRSRSNHEGTKQHVQAVEYEKRRVSDLRRQEESIKRSNEEFLANLVPKEPVVDVVRKQNEERSNRVSEANRAMALRETLQQLMDFDNSPEDAGVNEESIDDTEQTLDDYFMAQEELITGDPMRAARAFWFRRHAGGGLAG